MAGHQQRRRALSAHTHVPPEDVRRGWHRRDDHYEILTGTQRNRWIAQRTRRIWTERLRLSNDAEPGRAHRLPMLESPHRSPIDARCRVAASMLGCRLRVDVRGFGVAG